MDNERTANAREEVQPEIDPQPVIRNGAVDIGLRCRETGKFTAEPETKRPDFPGALGASPQRPDGTCDILGLSGEGGDLRAERDVALGRVEIAKLATILIGVRDIGQDQQPRSFSRFRDSDVSSAGCDVDEVPAHGDLLREAAHPRPIPSCRTAGKYRPSTSCSPAQYSATGSDR